jgi:hypothetical protein
MRVCPDVTPLELKPAPEPETCEIVTVEFSLFVRVTVCETVLPRFTFPKFTVVGAAFNPDDCATPIPLRPTMTVGDVGALLVITSEPVTLPELAGVKTILIVPDPPVATVIGTESWPVLNPGPVMLAAVIDSVALPVLDTVIDCVALPPTCTSLNNRLLGVTEMCGEPCGACDGLDLIADPQPESSNRSNGGNQPMVSFNRLSFISIYLLEIVLLGNHR